MKILHLTGNPVKRHHTVLIFVCLCLSLSFRLWRKERARTTTWTTANWSACWCSGRRSWRGRRRSLSGRNVCWRSGRWSWRGWSRRSEIWRTTLTRCWCASWSRSPLSCKCGPSWSDEGFAAQSASVHSNLHNSSLVFSLLCCPFWYKCLGTERCRGDVFLTACFTVLKRGLVERFWLGRFWM